jgi:pimeloyl-ACP methyl ester carboxylesterase
VTAHPFAEEQKFSHRVFVNLARDLARRDVATLRFDLSGSGDSYGEERDATVSQWVEEIRAGLELMKTRFPQAKPVLMGLRLGATLALSAAGSPAPSRAGPQGGRTTPPPALVLWEPILDGKKYVDEILRRRMIREMMTTGKKATGKSEARAQLESDGFLDLDATAVGKRMIEEMSALDAKQLAARFKGKALLVQIAFNAKVSKALEDLAAAMTSAGAQAQAVGIREQVIWDRVELVEATELIRVTADWVAAL